MRNKSMDKENKYEAVAETSVLYGNNRALAAWHFIMECMRWRPLKRKALSKSQDSGARRDGKILCVLAEAGFKREKQKRGDPKGGNRNGGEWSSSCS